MLINHPHTPYPPSYQNHNQNVVELNRRPTTSQSMPAVSNLYQQSEKPMGSLGGIRSMVTGVAESIRQLFGRTPSTVSHNSLYNQQLTTAHNAVGQLLELIPQEYRISNNLQQTVDHAFLKLQSNNPETRDLNGAFSLLQVAGEQLGLDPKSARAALQTILNWNALSNQARIQSAGNLGINLLENTGVITSEQSEKYHHIANTLGQAVAVFNSNLPDSDKAIALSQLGVNAAAAHDLISQSSAHTAGSVINVANLINNWDQYDTGERVHGVATTTAQILDSLGVELWQHAGTQAATQLGQQAAQQAIESGATVASETLGQAVSDAASENAAASGITGADIGSYAAYAYKAYKLYDGWNNKSDYVSDEQMLLNTGKQIGLAVADIYTFGLASVAYGALSTSEEFRDLEELLGDLDPLTGFGALNRKTTKMYQAERAQAAIENAATDIDKQEAAYQWQKKLQANESGEASNYLLPESSPLAGRKYDWQELKHTVIDSSEVLHYQGFRDVFPDLISGFTAEQRAQIAEAAIDLDLLSSDKGNIIFAGDAADKIRAVAEHVRAGSWSPVRSREQRYQDMQTYLQQLSSTEGYQSSWLGKPQEEVEWSIQVAAAVDVVDRARAAGEPIPEEANQILTVEHLRREKAAYSPSEELAS